MPRACVRLPAASPPLATPLRFHTHPSTHPCTPPPTPRQAELRARGFAATPREGDGLPLLGDALGWMELQVASPPHPSGDHDVVICEVTAWGGGPDQPSPAQQQQQQQQAGGREQQQGDEQQQQAGGREQHEWRPLYTSRLRELGLM